MTRNPSDWYADPEGKHQYRYWDGNGWTHHVSNNGTASIDPMSSPAVQAQSRALSDEAERLVLALASRPVSSDAQVRSNILDFLRASGQPTDLMELMQRKQQEPDIFERPWRWLVEQMRLAVNAGDHRVAAAGFYWAIDWLQLMPKLSTADKMDLPLETIPPELRLQIQEIGNASAGMLPPDSMVVGDERDGIPASLLAHASFAELGL